MSKILLSLSGGMDSTTLLAEALHYGHKVSAVLFIYGSKHNLHELTALQRITKHYQVLWQGIKIPISEWVQSRLLMSGGELPEGHYEDESMKQTVVPGRNLIFISILAGMAMSRKLDEVWLGVHAGDYNIYPDCRPKFINYAGNAIDIASEGRVRLETPYTVIDKTDILKRGLELKVPYELTRTCYKDQPIACGKCGSCQERLTAFAALNTPDPLEYESRELIPRKE